MNWREVFRWVWFGIFALAWTLSVADALFAWGRQPLPVLPAVLLTVTAITLVTVGSLSAAPRVQWILEKLLGVVYLASAVLVLGGIAGSLFDEWWLSEVHDSTLIAGLGLYGLSVFSDRSSRKRFDFFSAEETNRLVNEEECQP